MRKHIRKLSAMLMVVMVLTCLATVSASAAYDAPTASSVQPTTVGWTLYINGQAYEVDSTAEVGWGTASGRNVYIVQIALNALASRLNINCGCGDADGVFGNNTWNGIKNFQTYCNSIGLYGYNQAVDGVVGKTTWNRFAAYLG